MTMQLDVHSHQILRLQHEAICLYAEVIQIVSVRSLYWLRPLALVYQKQPDLDQSNQLNESQFEPVPNELYDLRQGPDLLIPQILCQPALDTEVLPLLTQLESLKDERDADKLSTQPTAQQHLQALMRQLYQARPEVFQAPGQS
jgi:hypothetical protein